jgi:uncharacterized repeat protein (TIGR03847 family)
VDTHRLDLGLVAGLSVQSFGEPGQRTFRVLAETSEGTVSLWLEKEQIAMLGGAVEELLTRVVAPRALDPRPDASGTFVGDLEVRVGALALGYDTARNGFTIEATEFSSQLPLDEILLLADRRQLEDVRDQVQEILAASRPRCVLCGTPLTGEPHFCPQSNGHAHLDEEQEE